MYQENSIRTFSSYMPKNIVDKFQKEQSLSGKYVIAEQWWNSQVKPFVPVHNVARFFNHENLFMRYHAAKAIETKYDVVLWNENENAIDNDAVQIWLKRENIDI